jgi:hypothetical protein
VPDCEEVLAKVAVVTEAKLALLKEPLTMTKDIIGDNVIIGTDTLSSCICKQCDRWGTLHCICPIVAGTIFKARPRKPRPVKQEIVKLFDTSLGGVLP